jgi:hypothetical protein
MCWTRSRSRRRHSRHVALVGNKHHMEEEWEFLLIDARNAFNEGNQTVRHEWPSGARFTFNCYRHWSTPMIRGKATTAPASFFTARKVSHRETLSRCLCMASALSHSSDNSRRNFQRWNNWYADDVGAGGKFDAIRQFTRLKEIGPNFGYFPEPSKSILIVPLHSFEHASTAFVHLGFKITTGSRYLVGGFIGEKGALDVWTLEKIDDWSGAVVELASAAKVYYPQAAFAGLRISLQQEWQFVQRFIKEIGGKFTEIEKEISQAFLPALFGDVLDEDDPRQALASLPVKHAGLAIPNPVRSSDMNYEASILASSHLVASVRGVEKFHSADHLAVIRNVRNELKSCHERWSLTRN